ncbi:MAG: Holliday junction branch migration protein RuvA [Bacteroidales bacterium]|jgi:Holliday junction DNA helicase RuvA|nr:Holliday junction branch migration protein RuvA [Bacteroidales bacterium]
MYNYIEGKISEAHPAYVVLDCSGIGYLIHISLNSYTEVKDLVACKLYVHLHVREDAMELFGFFSEQERRLFRYLISVNGIGSNTALLILSSLPPEQLMNAILSENVALLKAVKGIGPKTAQRVIIELKDKIAKEEPYEVTKVDVLHNTKREEALSGLVVLGFARLHAAKVVDQLIKQNPEITVEMLIKESLKIL